MGEKWRIGLKSIAIALILVSLLDFSTVNGKSVRSKRKGSNSTVSVSVSESIPSNSTKILNRPNHRSTEKPTIASELLLSSYENTTKIDSQDARFQDPFCPSSNSLSPCKCSVSVVECRGSKVSQEAIEKSLTSLRKFNGLRPHQVMSLVEFRLTNTRLTRLDLTPFIRTRIDSLKITSNDYLLELFGPETVQAQEKSGNISVTTPDPQKPGAKNKEKVRGKIQVTKLDLSNNALTDEGLTDVFKYFSGAKLKSLNLAANRIEGAHASGVSAKKELIEAVAEVDSDEEEEDAEGEFLPGFSKLNQLRVLNLSLNSIPRLANGPFRRNNRLNVLALENDNMEELGKDAFLFEELDDLDGDSDEAEDQIKAKMGSLSIYLNFNSISDEDVHSDTGLENIERPTKLYLRGNQIESLSARHFEGFLTKDESSMIDLRGNPLRCTKKMRWLTKQSNKVKNRVRNALCANDPGKTLFTTNALRRSGLPSKATRKNRRN